VLEDLLEVVLEHQEQLTQVVEQVVDLMEIELVEQAVQVSLS
jgi:hypothetical protein